MKSKFTVESDIMDRELILAESNDLKLLMS